MSFGLPFYIVSAVLIGWVSVLIGVGLDMARENKDRETGE